MSDYPEDWDRRRKHVYKRDNYTCQRCGRGGGPRGNAELHAHHRRPVSEGGSHHTQNLVTVCKNCHEQIHGHSIPTGGSSQRRKGIPPSVADEITSDFTFEDADIVPRKVNQRSSSSSKFFGPHAKMLVGAINLVNVFQIGDDLRYAVFVVAGGIAVTWGVWEDIQKREKQGVFSERQATLWPRVMLLSVGFLLPCYLFHRHVQG